jgi:hypothetical protein
MPISKKNFNACRKGSGAGAGVEEGRSNACSQVFCRMPLTSEGYGGFPQ